MRYLRKVEMSLYSEEKGPVSRRLQTENKAMHRK